MEGGRSRIRKAADAQVAPFAAIRRKPKTQTATCSRIPTISGRVTTYTYDANNNVASLTQQLDPNTPVTTSYTYNSFGEVLTMTDPLGNVTTNAYDAKGNLTSVMSPKPDTNTAASVTQFGRVPHPFAFFAKGWERRATNQWSLPTDAEPPAV